MYVKHNNAMLVQLEFKRLFKTGRVPTPQSILWWYWHLEDK
jgi:hypothetical protein